MVFKDEFEGRVLFRVEDRLVLGHSIVDLLVFGWKVFELNQNADSFLEWVGEGDGL